MKAGSAALVTSDSLGYTFSMGYQDRDWYDKEERKRAAQRLGTSSSVEKVSNPYKEALRTAAPASVAQKGAAHKGFHWPSAILGFLVGGWLVYIAHIHGQKLLDWLQTMA